MALTLRDAITATQTTFDVDGADDLSPGALWQLESEVVEIRSAVVRTLGWSETTYQRVSVYRQRLGTTRAPHDAGTSMESYTLDVQRVRLLGPFNVEWNTADIDTGIVLSEELPVGSLVLAVYGEPVVEFTFAGESFDMTISAFLTDTEVSAETTFVTVSAGVPSETVGGSVLGVGAASRPFFVGSDLRYLGLRIVVAGDPMTAGEVNFYALLAEPA